MKNGSPSTRGTDEEKEKYNAIDVAHAHLLRYKYLFDYTQYLKTCYPLPIILKNTGAAPDEEIQVTLKFPKTATVVTPHHTKTPFEPFLEEFIHDNYVFNDLLSHLENMG